MSRVDRIQLLYDLTFRTPFHCGTGLRSGLIDRTIVRDAEGYLYVPGSTIKGALRMHCEGLSRLYEQADEDMRDRIDSPHNMKNALWDIGNRTTMITRIFGSHHHPGRLFFDDAYQTDQDKRQYDSREKDGKGKYQSLQTDLYTQVRLDRPTRTAVPGALYTSEFGIKGFTFKGSIIGWLECLPIEALDDRPTYSLLLLLAGLHVLDRLGGNRSTGKGQCGCEITQLLINGESYTDAQWKPWLDHLEALSYYAMIAASQEEAPN
jgi:CRISPR/Cas system CSM-associated protein Csm3 (group 7 of RAMP superfamily)